MTSLFLLLYISSKKLLQFMINLEYLSCYGSSIFLVISRIIFSSFLVFLSANTNFNTKNIKMFMIFIINLFENSIINRLFEKKYDLSNF